MPLHFIDSYLGLYFKPLNEIIENKMNGGAQSYILAGGEIASSHSTSSATLNIDTVYFKYQKSLGSPSQASKASIVLNVYFSEWTFDYEPIKK